MKTFSLTVDEIIRAKGNSPLPIEVFPNLMDINLCCVDRITWQEEDDGQLANLSVYFIPSKNFSLPSKEDV